MDEIGTGVGSIVIDDKNGLRLVIDHQVSTKLKNRCCGVVDPATGAIWTNVRTGMIRRITGLPAWERGALAPIQRRKWRPVRALRHGWRLRQERLRRD
jgi:hypothetical protein